MDSSSASNEKLFNMPIVRKPSTSFIMIGVSNRNSVGRIEHGNTPLNLNGSELNPGTSLSDDSGVTLTTNSSISSGDSIQLDMCKYEIDITESDEDASFQSFDRCSIGGMSAENFNTLKRGPFAPIDPPLEFQDSPKTVLRSADNNATKTINSWPLSRVSYEDPQELDDKVNVKQKIIYESKHLNGTYSFNKHVYSSDSFLNAHTDNIYDEPNNIISTSLENCIDVCVPKTSSPFTTFATNISSNSTYIFDYEKNKCQQSKEHKTKNSQMLKLDDELSKNKYYINGETKNKKTNQHGSSPRKRILKNQPYTSFQYNALHYPPGSCTCGNRVHSRNSLNSRLSSSHNSLCIHTTNKADDSIFITQAMSHDALLTREISDFYNVPIDSDIYAFPIDMVTSRNECLQSDKGVPSSTKDINILVQSSNTLAHRLLIYNEKETVSKNYRVKDIKSIHNGINKTNGKSKKLQYPNQIKHKNSLQSNEQRSHEPLHTTLEEVKQFYQTLYSGSSGKTKHLKYVKNRSVLSSKDTVCNKTDVNNGNLHSAKNETTINSLSSYKKTDEDTSIIYNNDVTISGQNSTQYQIPNSKNNLITCKHIQSQQFSQGKCQNQIPTTHSKQTLSADKKSQFNLNLKQKLCSIFKFRKSGSRCVNSSASDEYISNSDHTSMLIHTEDKRNKFQSRALPPVPKLAEPRRMLSCSYIDQRPELQTYHFTSSIEKVKDYGWYWGPLSSEAAENILSNEPDGSFIVRDSSDDHYIFSLSFKLNNCVRHVRIEQDQGTFSFGSYAKFKSQTITEFIEKAVDHSRSGRYLFFLHRRPEHGPMRVQLTNPVSRFKHVQSLQHICRFVILKAVIRKDLIQTLPLPRRLLDYINYKHCYSEQVESDCSHFQITGDISNNTT